MGIDAAMTQAELRARPGRRAARLDRRACDLDAGAEGGPRPVSSPTPTTCSRASPSRARRSSTGAASGTRREPCPWRSERTGRRACTSSGSSPPTARSATRRSSSARPRSARVHASPSILPTNTWQAYNFWDADGNGWGDTWYAGFPNKSVALSRPFLRRGVPPFFYRYDQGFLHWLYWTGKTVDFLAESDLDDLSGDDLAHDYDLVVYPGHSEYVTTHEYDAVERYRNLGGNLIFLSANNFFWRVSKAGTTITRETQWRDLGRPEASLIGVQYLANDRGERQGLFRLLDPAPAAWLWAGTGLVQGSTLGEAVGGYGIEIDHTAPQSPPGTIVLAEIPDLYGPGLTAQMSYYETAAARRSSPPGRSTSAAPR